MSVLPLSEGGQLATRADITTFGPPSNPISPPSGRRSKSDLADARAEATSDFAALRAEVDHFRATQQWIIGLLIAVLAAALVTGLS